MSPTEPRSNGQRSSTAATPSEAMRLPQASPIIHNSILFQVARGRSADGNDLLALTAALPPLTLGGEPYLEQLGQWLALRLAPAITRGRVAIVELERALEILEGITLGAASLVIGETKCVECIGPLCPDCFGTGAVVGAPPLEGWADRWVQWLIENAGQILELAQRPQLGDVGDDELESPPMRSPIGALDVATPLGEPAAGDLPIFQTNSNRGSLAVFATMDAITFAIANEAGQSAALSVSRATGHAITRALRNEMPSAIAGAGEQLTPRQFASSLVEQLEQPARDRERRLAWVTAAGDVVELELELERDAIDKLEAVVADLEGVQLSAAGGELPARYSLELSAAAGDELTTSALIELAAALAAILELENHSLGGHYVDTTLEDLGRVRSRIAAAIAILEAPPAPAPMIERQFAAQLEDETAANHVANSLMIVRELWHRGRDGITKTDNATADELERRLSLALAQLTGQPTPAPRPRRPSLES